MKHIITAILCSTMLVATTAFAGGGTGHAHGPISKTKAVYKAEKRLAKLVDSGKIDKSWNGKKAATAEQKQYKSRKEWMVTFKNPELSDKSKQTLYMFFKIDGHYLATNHTGK